MVFELRVATRYLMAAKLQSLLLTAGVAVGVIVFTFMAGLMNGLGVRLINDVTGSAAHVTLEPESRMPRVFMAAPLGQALFAIEPGQDVSAIIRTYRPALELARRTPGVRAAVPEVFGNATLARGEKNFPVAITGIEPNEASTIAPLAASLVRGRLALGTLDIVIGRTLAEDLGVDIGDRVVLRSGRNRKGSASPATATVTVRGIFTLGIQAIDERVVYMDLGGAQNLLDLTGGVSVIEIKVDDVWQASAVADRLGRGTHLKASSWLDRNARLQEGLRAQASSSAMIKGFSLLTIAIGVASALYLSVARRRSEIGILRSFGIGRGAIVRTFVLQGLFVGGFGSLIGVVLGFGFAHLLLEVSTKASGVPSIPIDPAQGEYLRAAVLATVASGLAAILPALTAARIDPLEAIQS